MRSALKAAIFQKTSTVFEHHVVDGQSNAWCAGAKPPITLIASLPDITAMFGIGINTWNAANSPSAPANRTGDFTLAKLDPAVSGYENMLVQTVLNRSTRESASAKKMAVTYSGQGSKRLAELSSLDLGTAPAKGYWITGLDDMARMRVHASNIGARYRLSTYGIASCENDVDMIINPGEAASTPVLARNTVSSRLRMMVREKAAAAVALGSPPPAFWVIQPSTVAGTLHFTIAQGVLNAVDPTWVDPVNGEAVFPNGVCVGPSYPYDSAINSYFGATRSPEDFSGYAGLLDAQRIHYTSQSSRQLGAKVDQALRVKATEGRDIALQVIQVTDDPDFPGNRTHCLLHLRVYAPPVVIDTDYFPEFLAKGIVAYPNNTIGSTTSPQNSSVITVWDDGRGEAANGITGAVYGMARLKVTFAGAALPANSRVVFGRFSNLAANASFKFVSQIAGPTRRGLPTYDYTFSDVTGLMYTQALAITKRSAFSLTRTTGSGPGAIYIQDVVSNGAGVTVLRGEQGVGGVLVLNEQYRPMFPTVGINIRDSDITSLGVNWVDTWYGDQTLIGTPMPASNWLCCGELIWS